MISHYHRIRNAIAEAIKLGKGNFIIYPYGENGFATRKILNDNFGIKECYIVDNKLAQFNTEIKNFNFLKSLNVTKFTVLFTCANVEIFDLMCNDLFDIFPKENVVIIFEELCKSNLKNSISNIHKYTQSGKYSYGPLCNHWLVKSVGNFCSFAMGCDVVENHAIEYISTHVFLYYGGYSDTVHERKWEDLKGEGAYFDGIKPKGQNYKLERITIGSDVWLGKNVLITNSSNIGNGVIAGAGAVITKDIPDYAVVAGVPARIIRYRYTKEEIEALNRIAWWDWSDEKIRENYEDFYLDVKQFISKHIN